MAWRLCMLAAVAAFAIWPALWADEIQYVERNGIKYAETVRKVRCPVTETRLEEQEVTVYRPQCRTEIEERRQVVLTPVTEYRWEAYWAGRWNPFQPPYLAQRLVPHTRWEQRTEVVKVPVVRRDLIAEKRLRQIPRFERRFVERSVVTSRVAVSAPASPRRPDKFDDDPFDDSPLVAQRGRIGGVSKLESDPPRRGIESAWRSARDTRSSRETKVR